MDKQIKQMTLDDMKDIMAELGQPSYRAKQLYEWVALKNAQSYDDMTNLPKTLRAALQEQYPLATYSVVDKQVSQDDTRKYVLQFCDGAKVETVGIPSKDGSRLTVCFSTQAGCAMGCAFCATGQEGLTRNLQPYEMVDQVSYVASDFGKRVTNVVAMGQGEPFNNYENVIEALQDMNDPGRLGIGARHITISTCGVIGGIRKLAKESEQFTLAVSLHSAIQEKRDELMPRMSSQPLAKLKSTLNNYTNQTKRRVTFEYLMIKGVNDGEDDLKALIDFTQGMLCHVNLLPMNAVDGTGFEPSDSKTISLWQYKLGKEGVETSIRRSRGSDISGACGQLKNKLS